MTKCNLLSNLRGPKIEINERRFKSHAARRRREPLKERIEQDKHSLLVRAGPSLFIYKRDRSLNFQIRPKPMRCGAARRSHRRFARLPKWRKGRMKRTGWITMSKLVAAILIGYSITVIAVLDVTDWFWSIPHSNRIAAVMEARKIQRTRYVSETIADVLGGEPAKLWLSFNEAVDVLNYNLANISFILSKELHATPEMRQLLNEGIEKYGQRPGAQGGSRGLFSGFRGDRGGKRTSRETRPGDDSLAGGWQGRVGEVPSGAGRPRDGRRSIGDPAEDVPGIEPIRSHRQPVISALPAPNPISILPPALAERRIASATPFLHIRAPARHKSLKQSRDILRSDRTSAPM